MNAHPLVVHFPIALLSIYAVLECVRFRKVMGAHGFFNIKTFLLVVGVGAIFTAYVTGEIAEEELSGGAFSKLIDAHSLVATISVIIFSVLAYAYIVTYIRSRWMGSSLMIWISTKRTSLKVWMFLDKIARIIRIPSINVGLAVFGFLAIFITGALGGAIVYGPDIDPAVSFVYHMIIK